MVSGKALDSLAVPLSDGVVTVRKRRADDLPYLAAATDDPEAAKWLDEAPAGTPPSTPAQIEQIWKSGTAAPMLIADAASDEPAGLINVQFRPDADTSIAYRVFPNWRGHGYAGRALELVADWAFTELDEPRIVLEIDETNTASIRVAEQCNFERDGVTETHDPPKAVYARNRPAQ